ncbi:LLM class flavin-dependent oxidoreductase [Nocardia sp. NPDC058497]|uniref:LLM class flavin-dependent oxidoreductase n=1 Tax=Nocardia sp. NPDC058497 TaxID=3346529 RepID=UPI0036565C5F
MESRAAPLPNHQPLVVAEQFGMLGSLFPGRIDMGLGRSVGFTDGVRRAPAPRPAAVSAQARARISSRAATVSRCRPAETQQRRRGRGLSSCDKLRACAFAHETN